MRGMRPIAPGVTGELYLGGSRRRQGYYAAARLTAARFVPNPVRRRSRAARVLYRTGDLVRRGADGELQFVGRADNQVKVRGVRIELEEIERVFRESFAVATPWPRSTSPRRGGSASACSTFYRRRQTAATRSTSPRSGRLGRRLPA